MAYNDNRPHTAHGHRPSVHSTRAPDASTKTHTVPPESLWKEEHSLCSSYFSHVSIALSSMQVALAVPVSRICSPILVDHELQEKNRAFWLFCIAVVLLWLLTWVLLLGIPLVALCSQFLWAFGNREEKQAIYTLLSR